MKIQKRSKMVKNPRNLKKSLLFLKKSKKFDNIFFVRKKKCNPFSFPILGGQDLTRALLSSPLQSSGGVPSDMQFVTDARILSV